MPKKYVATRSKLNYEVENLDGDHERMKRGLTSVFDTFFRVPAL